VKRSTLNFSRGDRKGACWAEYGDRHDIFEDGPIENKEFWGYIGGVVFGRSPLAHFLIRPCDLKKSPPRTNVGI